MVTKGTLLDDAPFAHGDVGVLAWRLFLVAVPVKIFRVVGTRRHAKAATDATRIDLRHYPFGIPVGRINGTNLGARRIVALETGPWNKARFGGVMFFVSLGQHLHPTDHPAALRLIHADGRNVVLGLTRHHTGLAAGTTIQVDDHSPQSHVMLSSLLLVWYSARQTRVGRPPRWRSSRWDLDHRRRTKEY